MAWTPTNMEIKKVSALDAEGRYRYFIKRVADIEEVWSLGSDGWALAGDDDGRQLVPIWPHPIYAERCATRAWAGYEPRLILLKDFLRKWVPGMKRDNRLAAVFQTEAGKGVPVEPDRLREDIETELENYDS